MGKTCLITGASQGIGRAAAIRMAREPGVSAIVLVARNAEGLAETRAAMDVHEDTTVKLIPYDLGGLDGIPDLVRDVHDEFGSIDLLLNIAGYAEPKSLLDTSAENLVRTFTINVFAMLLLTREFVRYMQGRPAKVLNVASTAGITSRPGWVAYAASKAAVVSLLANPRRRARPGRASRSTASRPGARPQNSGASSRRRRTPARSCSRATSRRSSRP
ncbi:MAG: SDR family oxidoreductase [Candidatus Limnocylindrales bacterium]